NRKSSADLFRMVAELDSSFSQVKMLFLLEDGGEQSVKEIADRLGLSLPAASRAVDGLSQRGYVTRRASATDRRSRLVALTGDGPQGRRRGGRRRGAARPPPDAGGVRGRAHAGGAGLPLHGPPPHRRKDHLPVTDRLRLTDANRRWWTLAAMCFALAMVMLDN